MGFLKPSKIQAATIPLATNPPYENLIVQAPAGSGKTGAFAVTTLMRVDTNMPPDIIQVMVVVNTRELCNQIHKVYEKLVHNTGITLSNFAAKDKKPAQVVVTVHGSLGPMLSGRKPLNLKELKCVVVDEADVFFKPENFEHLWKLKDYKGMPETAQWILFSATFPTGENQEIDDIIGKLAGKCIQIKVEAETSMERIKHIQQYVF